MYGSWGKYYAPIHLNNTNGNPVAGVTNWLDVTQLFNSTTTYISVLSDNSGSTYIPKSTNFIDVYSGGSPFTMTQELVQRGAEVQDDELRIVIVGKTRNVCYEIVKYLRLALTSQDYGFPAVLQIKRPSDTTYTEWFVQSANIQEEPTHFGRDIKLPVPSLFLKIKLTRSPYGADTSASYVLSPITIPQQSRFTIDNQKGQLFNVGDLINADFNFNLGLASGYGPLLFNLISDDTYSQQVVSVSGTLAAGATATVGTYTYAVQDIDSIGAPLSIIVVADVQSNEVEMRATIQGYSTPYIRAVGTQLSPTISIGRVFQLPSIDIASIFAGMPNYDNSYELPITISVRNINRGATRTYTVSMITMFRAMNIVQMFPTTLGFSDLSAQYRIVSFYDNLYLPAQPLPTIKGIISTSSNFSGSNSQIELRYKYKQAMEVRGTLMRIQKNDSIIYGYVVMLNGNCQIDNFSLPTLTAQFRFSHLYQSVGS